MYKLTFSFLAIALLISVVSCDTVQPQTEATIEFVNPVMESDEDLFIRIDTANSGPLYIYTCSNLIFNVAKKVDDKWESYSSTLCNGMVGWGFTKIAESGKVIEFRVPVFISDTGHYRLSFTVADDRDGKNERPVVLPFEVTESR